MGWKKTRVHRSRQADCATCRKLIGLAPKAAKYKPRFVRRGAASNLARAEYQRPAPVPAVQPQQASLDATGEVTLY